MRFFARDLDVAVEDARLDVARFLGADEEGVAFIPNATTGVSTALAAVPLSAGDEVLLTDHTYGAVVIAAERWCRRAGAELVTAEVPLGAGDAEAAAAVLDRVGDRTRLAVLDQVTSPTARRLPLELLLPELRSRGVVTVVDAAHAPGMLPLDLATLGADFWAGNLHKWACAPRGTAALYVDPSWRASVSPLVASWDEERGFPWAFSRTGTADPTPWLAAPRALRLLNGLGWERLRRHNVELAVEGQGIVAEALGLDVALLPGDPSVSMQLVPLPAGVAESTRDALSLQARIAETIAVEVAVTTWRGRGFVRVSAHAYNCRGDYERLADALPALL
jgi:isopenicillin-N epimerase